MAPVTAANRGARGSGGRVHARADALAELWHRILSGVSGQVLARRRTIGRHATSQIAKYLPGNVWHMVGRHVGLADATGVQGHGNGGADGQGRGPGGGGITHRALGAALLVEVMLLLAGAALISAVGGWAMGGQALAVAGVLVPGQVLALVALASAGALLAGAWVVAGQSCAGRTGIILSGLALTTLFFAGQGMVLYALFLLTTGEAGAMLLAAAAIAWTVGFLMPGAPAGLGPREAVLLTLAGPMLGEAPALVAIVLFRVVTTLGDVVLYLIGAALVSGARDRA